MAPTSRGPSAISTLVVRLPALPLFVSSLRLLALLRQDLATSSSYTCQCDHRLWHVGWLCVERNVPLLHQRFVFVMADVLQRRNRLLEIRAELSTAIVPSTWVRYILGYNHLTILFARLVFFPLLLLLHYWCDCYTFTNAANSRRQICSCYRDLFEDLMLTSPSLLHFNLKLKIIWWIAK